jgi:hypothetical protein
MNVKYINETEALVLTLTVHAVTYTTSGTPQYPSPATVSTSFLFTVVQAMKQRQCIGELHKRIYCHMIDILTAKEEGSKQKNK